MRRKLALLTSITMLAAMVPSVLAEQELRENSAATEVTYNYDGTDHIRRMEKLNRGLTAVKTNNGVFLSWRLLGNEASVKEIIKAPSFDVYKNGKKIAQVDDSTNYVDTSGTLSDKYSVAPTVPETDMCESVSVQANNYFDIPLVKPENETITYTDPSTGETSTIYESLSFSPSDCSCGDLDGDGEYEIIVKWISSEHDVGSPGSPAYSGTVRFAAYKMDGTKLWDQDINLGRNVYSSAHTAQFLVYDFDGDGKAEMTVQTSLGSTDGNGEYVSKAAAEDSYIRDFTDDDNANTDYRGTYGLFATGEEFLTVFNGETGAAMDTIKYPVDRYNTICWGTSSGGGDGGLNRSNRFVADVAYLDGVNPYAVYWRGYYNAANGRTGVCGVRFDGTRLHCDYIFDTLKGQPGYTDGNEKYAGNGNHNLTVADVDDDGKDEVISGAMCLEADENNKFNPRWCTFMEHGDALHIGDYDPTHKGLEFFTIHEDGGPNYMSGETVEINFGMSVIDADTGEIIFHQDGSDDTGRGVMANVGSGGYYQIWSSKVSNLYHANGGADFSAGSKNGYSQNFRIFWDADLYDELLDGTGVTSWNGSGFNTVFDAGRYGCVKINGTKSNPGLQADLFGDWREELVYPTSDGSALRVFTTTDVTNYKLPTLMHDPVYRLGVAAEQSCYNQPPHIGFYLADEIFRPAVTELEITKQPNKTVYNIGEVFDAAGLEVTAHFSDGAAEVVDGYVISGFDSKSAGTQTIMVTYGQQTAEFEIKIDSGFEIDKAGYITAVTRRTDSAVIPSSIDGVPVIGIRQGALKESAFSKLTIMNDPFIIEDDSLPDGIVLKCYLGSDVYVYAVEAGIKTEIVDPRDYIVNVDYSETEYQNLNLVQEDVGKSTSIGHIVYGVGGRNRGGGDGKTGFTVSTVGSNKVLMAAAGQFASNGRNAYMLINDTPALSANTDSVFETDFNFNDLETQGRNEPTVLKLVLNVLDGSGNTIDNISTAELGLESGKWYNYKLVCHNKTYYRIVSDADGNVISNEKIGTTSSDYGPARINILQESGDFGQGRNTYVLLDNTKVYTNVEFSNVILNITDDSGMPISKPSVTINGEQYTGSHDGVFSRELAAGLYELTISADGYAGKTMSVAAFKNSVSKDIVLDKEYIAVTGVKFEENAVSVLEGGTAKVTASVIPSNASDRAVSYASSNENIVTVDENGNIKGIAPGTATITAYAGAVNDICKVTVIKNGYEQTITSVKISGGEKIGYVPKTGTNTLKSFIAEAYDQNGVKMENIRFNWSSNNDKVSVSGGIVTIYPNAVDTAVITAEAGGKTAEAEIIIKDTIEATTVFAADDYENADIAVWIADPAMTQSVNGITYGCGSRNADGQSTYIRSTAAGSRKYITASAGKYWSANDRNAYMEFENAPESYESGTDYVFETDIMLHTGSYPMNVVLKHDRLIVTSLNIESLGIDADTWYHYQLIISDGKYIQTISDMDGNVISCKEINAETIYPINRIDFLGYNTTDAAVNGANAGLDNLRYYSSANALGSLSVRVVDEDGKVISGTVVKAGNVSAVTSSIGIAKLELPYGVYKLAAYMNDELIGTAQATLHDESVLIVINTHPAPEPVSEIESVDGNKIVLNTVDEGLKVYMVKYNPDNTLEKVLVYNVPQGIRKYTLAFEPDKVLLWDGTMKAVDSWTK